jgi:hypothetical protein
MPVWLTAPIDREPQIRLASWSVRELPRGDRHFVGWNIRGVEGRVSSRIVSFDPETRRGVTNSGRVYELVGDGGANLDADYVWHVWCGGRTVAQDPGDFRFVDESELAGTTAPRP